MNWLNIELSTLRSPNFLGSEPVDRATWLCLMAYCADQENSGVIKGCASWGDRKWQQIVGVTSIETRHECDLFRWVGEDLHLGGYPIDKQNEVINNRKNGKKGGRPKKAESASEITQTKPSGFHSLNQVVQNRSNGKERKGKEGKGIGKEEEIKTGAPDVAVLPSKKLTKTQQHDDAVKSATIPEQLNHPSFFDQWAEFCDMRRDSKKYLTANAISALLKKFDGFTVDEVCNALADSVISGWAGVFPKKDKNAPYQQPLTGDRDCSWK